MTHFITCLALFLSIQSFSYSSKALNHKIEIETAQAWADSFDRPYPIVIFNRDELHFRFLQQNASAPDKDSEKKRQSIIDEYIQEKIGLELTSSELSNLETQLYVTPGSAVAIPLLESYSDNLPYRVCAVFANAPNGNSQIEVERLTGLTTPDVYEDKSYHQLRIKEEFEVMYLFSMYHEVSHCLDQSFMTEAYNSYSPSAHDVHASESFAETLAYFQISKRFSKEIAEARILYRILYSRNLGEYFAQNPSVAFGNEMVLAGGAIYYLAPVLAKAYQMLSMRQINPLEATNEELYQAAESIVNENILHFRSFAAVVRSLENSQTIIDEYAQSSIKDPDLFFNAYEDLILYYATTDNWMRSAFDETQSLPENSEALAEAIPEQDLCAAIIENDFDGFLTVLDQYRESLNERPSTEESRLDRYFELNKLSRSLNEKCS